MDSYQTHFLAFGNEVVDCFLDSLGHGTHGYDHAVGIGSAVVVEQMVFAACDLADFSHVAFHDFRHGLVVLVAGFTVLEEHVAVFGKAACYGSLGAECALAEFGHCLAVQQGFEVFHFQSFDFLDFMGGTEAVEEVYKRYAAGNGGEMGYAGKIHDFLHGAFGEHGKAGLANGHHILVVAEDTEGVGCDCAGRYMEHGGQKLTGDFVHIGNHQQQTLGGGVGGGESTGLQGAVDSAGSAAFRLHFLHQDCFAEDVLASCGRPFVDIFSHCRRRCNGVDCGHFREHVAHVGGCLVTIAGQEFFFFAHKRGIYTENLSFRWSREIWLSPFRSAKITILARFVVKSTAKKL